MLANKRLSKNALRRDCMEQKIENKEIVYTYWAYYANILLKIMKNKNSEGKHIVFIDQDTIFEKSFRNNF